MAKSYNCTDQKVLLLRFLMRYWWVELVKSIRTAVVFSVLTGLGTVLLSKFPLLESGLGPPPPPQTQSSCRLPGGGHWTNTSAAFYSKMSAIIIFCQWRGMTSPNAYDCNFCIANDKLMASVLKSVRALPVFQPVFGPGACSKGSKALQVRENL